MKYSGLEAMDEFWNEFSVPAWLEGLVPLGTPMPYTAYTYHGGPFGRAVTMTATAWFTGEGAGELRAAFMEEAEERIPEEGAEIYCGDHLLLAERANDFLECITDPEDERVIGARIRIEVRDY